MNSESLITPVTEPATLKKVRDFSAVLINTVDEDIRMLEVIRRDWVAVPTKDFEKANMEEAERLSTALQRAKVSEWIGYTYEEPLTGPGPSEHYCYTGPSSTEAIYAYFRALRWADRITLPLDESFVILRLAGNYCVVSGPPQIAESILGKDLPSARQAWREAVQRIRDFGSIEHSRAAFLDKVGDYYEGIEE